MARRKTKLLVAGATATLILAFGIRTAAIKLGLQAFSTGDHDRATALLSPFDGWGDADSRAALGELYYHSAASKRDFKRALSVLLPAAERRNGESALLVGDIYQNGRAEKVDLGEAFRWYEVAAAASNVEGRVRLGEALLEGRGTDKNPARAADVLQEAYHSGDPNAAFDLGEMYLIGEGQPIDFSRAKRFLEAAVVGKIPHAYYELGAIYNNGSGVSRNASKAAAYFQQGFSAGDGDSSGILGEYYKSGDGVEPSLVLAYVAYNIGSALGCDDCKRKRNEIEAKMTPEEVRAAQALCSQWEPGSPFPTKLSPELLALQSLLGVNRNDDAKSYAVTRVWFSTKLTVANRPELAVFIAADEIDPTKQCHSCGAAISVVTFQNIFPNGLFEEPDTQRNVFGFGAWGMLGVPYDTSDAGKDVKQDFQISKLDDNRTLLLLDDAFSNGGGSENSKFILGFDGLGRPGKLGWRQLGSVTTGESTEEDCGPSKTHYSCSEWKGAVQILSGAEVWPDIVVMAKGTRGFEPRKAIWMSRYHFNGTQYRLASSTDINGLP